MSGKVAERCPHCGQVLRPERLGVDLSPRQAEVFDIIKAASTLNGGAVKAEAIAERMGLSIRHVRVLVNTMRGRLEEQADYLLVTKGKYGYALVRVK